MIIHVLLVLPISLLLFSDYPCSTRSTHSSTSFQWLSMFYSFYPYLYFFSVIIHVLLVLSSTSFQWLSMFYSFYPYLYFSLSVIIHVLLVLPIALLLFSVLLVLPIVCFFSVLSMFYSFYPYFYFFSVIIHGLPIYLSFQDYPCSTRSTHSSTSYQWLSMFYSFYP